MRVRLFTIRYSTSLGGFDEEPLTSFLRDKDLLAIREHFFTVHEIPHVAPGVQYEEAPIRRAPAPNATSPRDTSVRRDAGGAADGCARPRSAECGSQHGASTPPAPATVSSLALGTARLRAVTRFRPA
jgi:hypothetical protein